MIVRVALFITLFVGIPTCAQTIQDGLAGLTRDAQVGRFRVANLYAETDGQVVGAKFWDRSGAPIYLLQIETVPQVFMWVDTPARSNDGLPHSLEHLLAGKGTKGRYVNLLKEMRLSQSAAATTDDFNLYSFSSGTGLSGFFEQFHAWLDALYVPDFTDLEAEREFYHFGVSVDPATEKRTLIEQGSVYNEMQSGQGIYTYYLELNKRVFGKDNPFGFYGSGVPNEMRSVVPSDIRRFYHERYKIGATTGFIFVLNPKDDALGFLNRISGEFDQFAGPGHGSQSAGLPAQPKYPVHPAPNTDIALFPFPSSSEADRGEIRFGWKPIKAESETDVRLLQLLLRAVGDGDKSLLYKSLIDRQTRKLDSGATKVESSVFLGNSPFFPAEFIGLSGVPGNKLNVKRVQRIRSQIVATVRKISLYPDGSSNLAAFNRLVASLCNGWRKSQLVWTKSAPRFGFNYDTDWKEYLQYFELNSSFIKSISDDQVWTDIDRQVHSKENIWRRIIRQFGLSDIPYATASVPSPQLLEEVEGKREKRLAAKVTQLMEHFGTSDSQQALERFEKQENAKTRKIDSIIAEVPRPRFTEHPPLTSDDDLQYSAFQLSQVPVTAAFFERPPTIDLGLSFDVRHIPHKYYKYLPLLPRCLDSIVASYPDLQRQIQATLNDFSVGYAYNPASRRTELRIAASATSPSEFRQALRLIKQITINYPNSSNTARLRDLVEEIRAEDDTFDKGENDFWFINPSYALRYEADIPYLAVASSYTRIHSEDRLWWMLHSPVLRSEITELKIFAAAFISKMSGISAKELARKLRASTIGGVKGELLKYWERSIPAFSDTELETGLRRLAREVVEDLNAGPTRTIDELRHLQEIVLDRKGLRVDLTLGRASLAKIQLDLIRFIQSIPKKSSSKTYAGDGDSDTTPIMDNVWVRYKLKPRRYPWYVGLVDARNEPANMAFYASSPGYSRIDHESLVQTLSSNLISGTGPHSIYMKTEEGGLAYASSISSDTSLKTLRFHAVRTSDITSLIGLVNSTAKSITELQDPSLIDNALQQIFPLPRTMGTFTERGRGIASDIRDGNDPERVKKFSQAVQNLRLQPDIYAQLTSAAMDSMCPVLLLPTCAERQQIARSLFVFIGSERLLTEGENKLGLPKILRVYPADFWLDSFHETNARPRR